jgi:hypothetical protein
VSIFEIIAEWKIQEAMKNGSFDNLAGEGKPLKLEDLSGISPSERMAYTILKNAGILPPEMEARKAISELEKKISEIDSDDEKINLKIKLSKMMTAYNVMMEKRKRK